MKKFHINQDGNVMPCSARIRECPFPASDHYLNKEIAVKESERRLATMNKTVPTLRKLKPGPSQLNNDKNLPESSLKHSIAEDKYTDGTIEPSLLNRFKNYKTDTTITGHLDSILYDVRSGQSKDKALTALSNNSNITEYDMMRIATLTTSENGQVLKNTKNRELINIALGNNSYVDTRHNALNNPLTTTEDLYYTTLMHPKNSYKKAWVSKLEKAGYPTEHINIKTSNKDAPKNLQEATALKKMVLTMIKRNNVELKSIEDVENFEEKIIKSSAYKKLSALYADNDNSLSAQLDTNADFVKRVVRAEYYSEKLDKTREIVKTKRYERGTYGRGHSNLPRQQYSPTTDNSAPSATPATSPEQADITKLDKFKNTVSMASLEESVELQQRWKNGIEELPLEMRKNVLNRRFNNTQEGLRGMVDLFKTSETEGQMVKSGLNNFVNHVNNMRENEKQQGYIAVDNPEFITPVGMIKVEEHVGNYDYGEKMVFRVNGEKFEMSKPMQSDRWSTFIHVKENTGTELEKPETKKGFWARLFS